MEHLGTLGEILTDGRERLDIALWIEIAGEEQFGRHTAGRARAGAITGRQFERAEQAGEADLLGIFDRSLPDDADRMRVHRILHGRAQLFGRLRLQVCADDLGEEARVQLVHLDRHERLLSVQALLAVAK